MQQFDRRLAALERQNGAGGRVKVYFERWDQPGRFDGEGYAGATRTEINAACAVGDRLIFVHYRGGNLGAEP